MRGAAVTSAADVDRSLSELCLDLGFCLPPDDRWRLRGSPPSTVDAFTDAVFRAEGVDPLIYPQLRKEVRERVSKHFLAAQFKSTPA
jgi:hypothetical protein